MLESILSAYTKLATLRSGEEGQTLVEYAMILGLVSIVCVAVVSQLGSAVNSLLAPVAGAF